jgi:hypothetical protein
MENRSKFGLSMMPTMSNPVPPRARVATGHVITAHPAPHEGRAHPGPHRQPSLESDEPHEGSNALLLSVAAGTRPEWYVEQTYD